MGKISANQRVDQNWAVAAEDGVVTKSEVYQIYSAANETGVSTQDVYYAGKAKDAARKELSRLTGEERAADARWTVAKDMLRNCGEGRECVDLMASAEEAERQWRNADKRLEQGQENFRLARRLENDLIDQRSHQGVIDQIYADFADIEDD